MAELVTLLLVVLASAIIFMSVGWLYAHRCNRVDVVDVLWGQVFIVIALVAFATARPETLSAIAVVLLVVLWGLRLSRHIWQRFSSSESQDERYTQIIANWPAGRRWLQVYLKVFVVQAVLATLIALPLLVIMASDTTSPIWLCIGVAVWTLGYGIEAQSDRQLQRFIANPENKGKLLQSGLWSYSRHPNYFGEITQWWGIWLVSLGTAYWLVALLGPLLITILIVFVSGVPIAERRAAKKPGWQQYKRKTSMLIPWPPKK